MTVAGILYFVCLVTFFNCPSFFLQWISKLAENGLHMLNNLFLTKTNSCRTCWIHICCKRFSLNKLVVNATSYKLNINLEIFQILHLFFYAMSWCSQTIASLCPAVFTYHVKLKLSRNILGNYAWKTNYLIVVIKESVVQILFRYASLELQSF